MTGTDQSCSASEASPRREYVALNGIRGMAAIGVVLFHGVKLVGPIFPRGYLAVDLFFVLSGFVIAHAYGDRLGATLTVRRFTLVRLVRFWPLYALGLGLGVARELLLIGMRNHYALSFPGLLATTVLGLAFIPLPLAQRGNNLFPLNVPSWSLFYELLVNILYAAVRPWLPTVVLVVAVVVSAIVLVLVAPATGLGHVGVTSATFGSGCVRTILSFSIGVLIYGYPRRARAVPVPLLLALVAGGLAWPWGGRDYDIAFVLLLSPMLVVLGAAAEPSRRLAAVAKWLGTASFPLYAIHRPLLQVVEAAAHRLPVSPALLGWLTVAVLLLLATYANRADVVIRRRLSGWPKAPLRSDPAKSAVAEV
jgi:peptidoglycan/LPS O-acetylase OafA/YrhL